MEVATRALSAVCTQDKGGGGQLVGANAQGRGLQAFGGVIGGHSGKTAEHAVGGRGG